MMTQRTISHRPVFMLAVVLLLALYANGRCDALYVDDDLVLKMQTGCSVDLVNHQFGTAVDQHLPQLDIYLLNAPSGVDLMQLAVQIESLAEVAFCHPNFVISPLQPVQGSLPISDEFHLGDFELQEAAQNLGLSVAHDLATGAGTQVAVLDGGVDYNHPVLQGSVVSGYDYVDDDTDANDEPGGANYGHGTFVSGMIHLVAPDAEIWSYRVSDSSGQGNGYVVAEAMLQAIEDGCDVINLSLVTVAEHQAIAEAAQYARQNDVVVVVAAGNGNTDLPRYPASDSNTVAVAAVDSLNLLADFSSYGDHIDICAPGTAVYGPYQDNGYAWWGGTSFATPFVSGQVALIQSFVPGLPWDYILDLILTSALNIDSVNMEDYSGLLGAGLINPGAALGADLVCGDLTRDGTVKIDDIVTMIDHLYFSYSLLTRLNKADVDGWSNVNGNDLQRLIAYLFQSGSAPDCELTMEPPFPTSDDTLELRDRLVPPNSETWTVELWMSSQSAIDAVVFPFHLSDTSSAATIDSIVIDEALGDLWQFTDIQTSDQTAIIGLHNGGSTPIPAGPELRLATIHFSNVHSPDPRLLPLDTVTFSPSNTVLISRNGGTEPSLPIIIGIASNPNPSGQPCIGAIRGNVDCDISETIDVGDLAILVDYLFSGGPAPACVDEADLDADGRIMISDVAYLVDFMFGGGPPPLPCP